MGEASKFRDVEVLVDEIIARRGRALSVALPIGIGKAVFVANELMRRAMLGELERLTIFTALSLGVPAPDEDLARRLMEPIQRRLYEDAPDLAYVRLREMGELPDHVQVHEFYYPPGSLLGNPRAQQQYTSVNFTHAIEVLLDLEIDVIAQMVAPISDDRWDLGGNTDLTLPLLETAAREGKKIPLLVVQVNERLPRMSGDAIVGEDVVDLVLENPRYHHELLGAPSLPPGDAEYALGLRAASLLRDGGTIQVGIGRVGEAVCFGACLRDQDAPLYNKILDALGRSPHEK
jgi:acyl-CoA hydrolase